MERKKNYGLRQDSILKHQWHMLNNICFSHKNKQYCVCLLEMKGRIIKPSDKGQCSENTSKRKRVTSAGSMPLNFLVEVGSEFEKERGEKKDILKQLFWVII